MKKIKGLIKMSNARLIAVGRTLSPFAGYFALGAIGALAQGPIAQVAQGASDETVNVVKLLAGATAAGSGASMMMDHDPGVGKKLTGLVMGGGIALFARPLITWIQGL